jgi:hypothetical protein
MYAASGENARLQDGDHADGRARGYVLTCDEQVISTTVVSFSRKLFLRKVCKDVMMMIWL